MAANSDEVARYNPTGWRHCCKSMQFHATFHCEKHPDPWDCPDYALVFNGHSQKYGIPIRDGGPAWIELSFCPFCGSKLRPVRG